VLGLGTKLEDLPGYIGKKLGIEADLLRTEVEREEMAQAAQAAQAAQQPAA